MTREQLERIQDESAAKGRELTADETLAAATGLSDFAKAQRGAPMTPAEIAAAKTLAAWNEWPGIDNGPRKFNNLLPTEKILITVGDKLEDVGFVNVYGVTTDEGRALLLRARAHGHLP